MTTVIDTAYLKTVPNALANGSRMPVVTTRTVLLFGRCSGDSLISLPPQAIAQHTEHSYDGCKDDHRYCHQFLLHNFSFRYCRRRSWYCLWASGDATHNLVSGLIPSASSFRVSRMNLPRALLPALRDTTHCQKSLAFILPTVRRAGGRIAIAEVSHPLVPALHCLAQRSPSFINRAAIHNATRQVLDYRNLMSNLALIFVTIHGPQI